MCDIKLKPLPDLLDFYEAFFGNTKMDRANILIQVEAMILTIRRRLNASCPKCEKLRGLIKELIDADIFNSDDYPVHCKLCHEELELKHYTLTAANGRPYPADLYRCTNPDCPAVKARVVTKGEDDGID